ncbi:5-(carboxyamino)imidazole ribonucleotide mutase [Alienimonas sp. DA493]|uniref:5-(carboxyamino)imidazole ribonucleotide mutase n=1 Tax=Alienimonas sp. DA493 TaxID=3373605 RepID=UPI0037544836
MSEPAPAPLVGVVMGSRSDLPTMRAAAEILKQFEVPFEAEVVSAHRTPDRLVEYAKEARGRGLKVIIAGAGGAAHLPGMLAASTTLPVLGVPVQSRALSGLDSLLSIVQMPGGVPVGTLAIGTSGAKNAALLAVRTLALSDEALAAKLADYHAEQTATVAATRVLTDDDLFPPASSALDHG